ncbi:MAG: bifunctional diaminohydroxyphosphoribosylaminopyrimidine deaminase/5-amino-6-(5-phosphoribosylamino)uracil reductase RibD [Spirochaetota bacterium]|nr:bifunctional diaminohydroxyphosphoribosylaminopyrimidine deaminase/5-amino-6-(5-phosphoribosylamino)uracil reductase RibD [Spirochaetota bacterium]
MGYITSDRDRGYMEKALQLAFSALGKTSPNPSVGAVIVKNNKIISTGSTSPCGQEHAEVVAIRNAGIDIDGSELYVSLEPCSHHGRTPPCTDAIIHSKITRVFIPLLDPNPLVAGNGLARLRKAGVEVVLLSEMADYASDLIRHFKKYILHNKGYIIHKSAITIDGKIATREGDSKWITSEYSRYIVHRLRAIVDAIIIGKNTLQMDNPTLNVRLGSFSDEVIKYFENSNIKIIGRDSLFLKMLFEVGNRVEDRTSSRMIVGLPEQIDFTKNIFFDDNFFFFVNERVKDSLIERDDYNIIKKLIRDNKILFIAGNTGKEQIINIVDTLSQLGKVMVMLEGGGRLAGSFYDAGEIDQLLYFTSPKVIGKGISPIEGEGVSSIQDSLKLYDISAAMIKEDILYNAYKEPFHYNMR